MQENSDSVCCSGAAQGADTSWGKSALAHGHSVMHFAFKGHRSDVPPETVHILSRAELEKADDHLERANKSLRRKWPVQQQYVANLLRRNYYQVKWSESLYAISNFDSYGMVSGGTAWAVQMMIDLHPGAGVYVFDQKVKQWYQWKGGWIPIAKPPRPTGVYAAVGTRELNAAGKDAIEAVFSDA